MAAKENPVDLVARQRGEKRTGRIVKVHVRGQQPRIALQGSPQPRCLVRVKDLEHTSGGQR